MAKFRVSVTETSYGSVEVTAACGDEAREKADQEYCNGNVCWTSGSHDLHDIVKEAPVNTG